VRPDSPEIVLMMLAKLRSLGLAPVTLSESALASLSIHPDDLRACTGIK